MVRLRWPSMHLVDRCRREAHVFYLVRLFCCQSTGGSFSVQPSPLTPGFTPPRVRPGVASTTHADMPARRPSQYVGLGRRPPLPVVFCAPPMVFFPSPSFLSRLRSMASASALGADVSFTAPTLAAATSTAALPATTPVKAATAASSFTTPRGWWKLKDLNKRLPMMVSVLTWTLYFCSSSCPVLSPFSFLVPGAGQLLKSLCQLVRPRLMLQQRRAGPWPGCGRLPTRRGANRRRRRTPIFCWTRRRPTTVRRLRNPGRSKDPNSRNRERRNAWRLKMWRKKKAAKTQTLCCWPRKLW